MIEVRERYRRDKAVSSTRNGNQISVAILAIPQGPTQRGDIDVEICLHDDRIRPNPLHEFAPSDQLARVFQKRNQDIEGTATDTHLSAGFRQEPLVGKQTKRPKRNLSFGRGSHRYDCWGSTGVGPHGKQIQPGDRIVELISAAARARCRGVSGSHERPPITTGR